MSGIGGWGSSLRDGSTATWSQPRASKALDALHKAKTSIADRTDRPYLRDKEEISSHALTAEEERKLTALCQKNPEDRTEDEVW